jgi:glutamate-1-semialdehyde 2,1-aminomutase
MSTIELRRNAFGPATLADAVAEATEAFVSRNPVSRERFAAAAAVLPGGNTRTSLFHEPFPLCMVGGTGCRLTDADGHEYLDFLGEFTAGILGHSPEPVKTAIRRALDAGMNLSSHTGLEAELAALLCARFPSFELVRFTNSGTEANLMALAAALRFTGRQKILVFENGYHGSVLTFAPGTSPVNVPHQFVLAPYNDLAGTRARIGADAAELGAILVEPMQGAAGCVPGTPEFLGGLRDLARETGAVLIFDEIQTSRLSIGGRQKLLGITPDMTTIGKFFGGGLAFGCFGGRREIMALYDPRRPGALMHAGTFNNNTLAMAAGVAAVTELLSAEALEAVNARGENFRERMNALFAAHAAPFRATGLGSLMNIHPQGRPEDVALLRKLLHFDLGRAGIHLAARGLIALSFPVTDDDIATFLRALEAFLAERAPVFPERDADVAW